MVDLGGSPALLVYVSVKDRRAEGLPTISAGDGAERVAAVVSIIALMVAPPARWLALF
jgi:hypothetical protein